MSLVIAASVLLTSIASVAAAVLEDEGNEVVSPTFCNALSLKYFRAQSLSENLPLLSTARHEVGVQAIELIILMW